MGASVAGRIDPGGDKDYFTITVSESTDLWVYTTGPTDTVGELTDDIGGTLASNDDRSVPGNTRNFLATGDHSCGNVLHRGRGLQGHNHGSLYAPCARGGHSGKLH